MTIFILKTKLIMRKVVNRVCLCVRDKKTNWSRYWVSRAIANAKGEERKARGDLAPEEIVDKTGLKDFFYRFQCCCLFDDLLHVPDLSRLFLFLFNSLHIDEIAIKGTAKYSRDTIESSQQLLNSFYEIEH